MPSTNGTAALATHGAGVLGSIEDFLAIDDDRPVVEVAVPEWGGRIVLMRAMSAIERDEWEYRFIADEHLEPDAERFAARQRQRRYGDQLIGQKAQLVARCVVARDGARLFTDEQASVLQERNAAVIDRLFAQAQELCGFTKADLAALEAAKNASASRDAGQPSGLPGS